MINLYYDNIIEDVPAPNGAKELALTTDARRIPYVKNHTIFTPISVMNTFYFVVRANKVQVNLFTEKQKAENLFYPIELADQSFNWDRSWVDLISKRARRMIKKRQMNLLILAPKVTGNHYIITRLNSRIQEIVDTGISPESITVIIGEIRGVYKNEFATKNVFGIDYQQIYTQLLYKTKWKQSDLHWIFGYDTRSKPIKNVNKDKFDPEKWNPKNIFNVMSSGKDHDIALLLEILYKQVDHYGNFDLDLDDYEIKELNNNYIDPRKSSLEKISKQDFLKNIKRYDNKNKTVVDKSFYANTLVNIVCDDNFLNVDTYFKQELAALSPGYNVWSQIAQGHPFMVIGSVDTMSYLNNEKYYSYNSLLPQDYDKMTTPTKRIELIVENIKKLAFSNEDKIKELIEESKPFMLANQKRFLEKKMALKFYNLFIDMRYE